MRLLLAFIAVIGSSLCIAQTPAGGPALKTNATKPKPNWSLEIKRNKMDDVPVYYLENNSFDSSATLVLRCQNGKFEIYVATGDYVEPEEGGVAGVRIKFDGDAPETNGWLPSSNNKSLFSQLFKDSPETLAEQKALLARLLAARKMLFEFTPYEKSAKTVSFQLAGLKTAITPKISSACGLDQEKQ